MKEFIKNIYKNTKRLLTGHDRVLVAVSTGLDSMVLLHMLLEMNVQVAIAHVNHGQREQSKDEELFIKNFAHENNIPIFIDYFTGEFSENAARQFRYDFFERIMREHNYTALLTGHHKDDQAETVFMKILRGARLFDIKGIKEKQPFANGELIRPLLKVTKRSCHVWNTSKMSLISKTII
jgi:tRNA(Ile)-lysidine synthase